MLKDAGLLRDQAYVDGQWIAGESGERVAVTNPADGSIVADVANLGAEHAQAAIDGRGINQPCKCRPPGAAEI